MDFRHSHQSSVVSKWIFTILWTQCSSWWLFFILHVQRSSSVVGTNLFDTEHPPFHYYLEFTPWTMHIQLSISQNLNQVIYLTEIILMLSIYVMSTWISGWSKRYSTFNKKTCCWMLFEQVIKSKVTPTAFWRRDKVEVLFETGPGFPRSLESKGPTKPPL